MSPSVLRSALNWLFKKLDLNVLDTVIIFLIPIAILWGFLFTPGYYSYGDVHFPLSTSVPPNPGNFGLNPLVPIGFSRVILGWLYFILSLLTNDVQLSERIFWYLAFVLYVFLAYALAGAVLSKFVKIKNKLAVSGLKLVAVIFMVSNFASTSNLADGGAIADALTTLFIATSAFAFVEWEDLKKAFYLVVALINLSVLLDPDYLIYFILVLLLVAAISGILKGGIVQRLKYGIMASLSSAISVGFIVEGLYLVSPVVSSASSALTLRPYSYQSIAYFSHNISPLFSFVLLGYSWSLLTFGPPTLAFLGKNITYVPAIMSPAQILLPNGPITYIWILSTFLLYSLILAIPALKMPRDSAPFLLTLGVLYAMSMVYYLRPLYYVELFLTKIPILGGAIGTSLVIPDHAFTAMASMYDLLVLLALVSIVSIKFALLNSKKLKALLIVSLAILASISGWQAFSGSLYPMRAPAVPYGNTVYPQGAFTPVPVSQDVISAYNLVSKGNDYYVLWIGGPLYAMRPFQMPGSPPGISEYPVPPYMPFLVANSLKSDLYYYLLYSGVRYVVVSGQDIVNPFSAYSNTFEDAGFANYSQAVAFLSSTPGLKEIYSQGNVTVFEVENYTSEIPLSAVVRLQEETPWAAVIPELFSTLNMSAVPTYSNVGLQFSVDNLTSPNVILDPFHALEFITNKNVTAISLAGTSMSETPLDHGQWLPNGFYIAPWGTPNASFFVANGTVVLNIGMSKNGFYTISYNGPFTLGPQGVATNGEAVWMILNFSAKAQRPEEMSVQFMAQTVKNGKYVTSIWTNTPFNVSMTYKNYTFSYLFPQGVQYIDFRIQTGIGPNIINISNLTVDLVWLPRAYNSSALPFGYYLILSNGALKAPINKTALALLSYNNTSYTWVEFNLMKGLEVPAGTRLAAMLILGNASAINERNATITAISYFGEPLHALYATYDGNRLEPLPTAYGTSVFVLPNSANRGNSLSLSDFSVHYLTPIIIIYYIIIIVAILIFLTLFALRSAKQPA